MNKYLESNFFHQIAQNAKKRLNLKEISHRPTRSHTEGFPFPTFSPSDFRIRAAASCRGEATRRLKSRCFGTTTGPTAPFRIPTSAFPLPTSGTFSPSDLQTFLYADFPLQNIPPSAFRLPPSHFRFRAPAARKAAAPPLSPPKLPGSIIHRFLDNP